MSTVALFFAAALVFEANMGAVLSFLPGPTSPKPPAALVLVAPTACSAVAVLGAAAAAVVRFLFLRAPGSDASSSDSVPSLSASLSSHAGFSSSS